MSNMDLNEVKAWVTASDCDATLHDRIWRAQETGCPRCRMFNPNWKAPASQTTPQKQRTTVPDDIIDLTTPSSVASATYQSPAAPSSSLTRPQQTTQTYGHGTGAYNALAGPADQKRLSGPTDTTKHFLKGTNAGAPAFAFRPETGKKIPAKSEKEIDITWTMHLATWTTDNFPYVEDIQFLGKPYYGTIAFNPTNTSRNTTSSACSPDR